MVVNRVVLVAIRFEVVVSREVIVVTRVIVVVTRYEVIVKSDVIVSY